LVDLRAVYVQAHQLAAREVLAVELEEARVLELSAFAVCWGYGEADALRDAGAEQICETPEELEERLTQTLERCR
jgi:hypothetical protein